VRAARWATNACGLGIALATGRSNVRNRRRHGALMARGDVVDDVDTADLNWI